MELGVPVFPVLLPSAWLPDNPSIAVLPFQNLSGDPEQEYFVDDMVEEIITALSRIPLAFRHRPKFDLHSQGQAIDVKRVGRELGVRYVLEGSVRKAGSRVRITALDRTRQCTNDRRAHPRSDRGGVKRATVLAVSRR